MDTILMQLYLGKICPVNQYTPILEEYKELRKKQFAHYESFVKKLESPLDEEFLRIMDEQMDTLPYEFSEMFIEGFRLGARMMLEILEDKCSGETS